MVKRAPLALALLLKKPNRAYHWIGGVLNILPNRDTLLKLWTIGDENCNSCSQNSETPDQNMFEISPSECMMQWLRYISQTKIYHQSFKLSSFYCTHGTCCFSGRYQRDRRLYSPRLPAPILRKWAVNIMLVCCLNGVRRWGVCRISLRYCGINAALTGEKILRCSGLQSHEIIRGKYLNAEYKHIWAISV